MVAQTLAPEGRLSLRQRRLPRWTPWLSAVASIALGIAVGAGAGLHSKIQWGLIAVVIFLGGQWVLSAAVEGRRQARDRLATNLVWSAFILAVIPLIALLWYTIQQGASHINADFLTHSMNGVLATDTTGGLYHALIGSLEQIALSTVIAAPIGVLTAVYLVEYGNGSRLAKAVTFFVDVMTGVPSIVAGLFVLSFWIILLNLPYSGFAGSIALAILMMPVVVRSTEEMLRLVPNELREAGLALGVPRWKMIIRVVIPTALGGIVTGVMLAIARITGETAPVLLLVFGSQVINTDPFNNPQQNLPLFVYQEYALGTTQSEAKAWAGALVLIAVVMILNLVARGIARWKAPKAAGR
ncbi:phosphate ABC transporter permease PstA [Phaeacidiphilus oryzae]|uniref:phosphate ABC transporter permease PstA n=1 Tax=Phaeacidiphilus oryzae TaxID=348818 RepID=UPI000565E36D|nr:phosphate ABC transporter permease PstA [Phaeacidiphilus oryzae]